MDQKQSVRRRLIDLAQRKQRPGSGSPASFLRRRTALMQVPDLNPIMAPLPWAVVGAIATRLYMPERATRDLDIAVRRQDGEQVRLKLSTAGFEFQGELSFGSSSWIG